MGGKMLTQVTLEMSGVYKTKDKKLYKLLYFN